MAAYAVGWWVLGTPGTGRDARPSAGLTALALGIQTSTVQRFGVSGMSTTYLTGTLTTVVIRLARGRGVREVGTLEILLGLVVGAGIGAVLVEFAPVAVPAVQLLTLGAVLLMRAAQQAPPRASELAGGASIPSAGFSP